MAAKVNINIDQGTSLNKVIYRSRTTMGANVDLSGLTGVCTLKKNYAASSGHTIDVQFSNTGDVRIVATANTTIGIPSGRYVYDILAHNVALGTYERIVEGYAAVAPMVSE